MTGEILLAAVAVLVVAGVALVGVFALRRWALSRNRGAVELSLRRVVASHGRGWTLGLGRYDGDALHVYRVFSLSPRPYRSLHRPQLVIQSRRAPAGPEAFAVQAGAVVLDCRVAGSPVQLALTPAALVGFLAWLESAAPGSPQQRPGPEGPATR